jgi:hypothetical protein
MNTEITATSNTATTNTATSNTAHVRSRSARTRGLVAGLAGLAAVVSLAGPMAGAAGAVGPRPVDPFGGGGLVVAPPTLPPTPPTLPPVVTIPPVVVADPGTDPAPQPTTPPAPQPTTPPAPQPTVPPTGGNTNGNPGGRGQQAPVTTPEQGVDAAFAEAGIVPTEAEETQVREVAEQAGQTDGADQGGAGMLFVAGLGIVAAGAATGTIVVAKRRRQARVVAP